MAYKKKLSLIVCNSCMTVNVVKKFALVSKNKNNKKKRNTRFYRR